MYFLWWKIKIATEMRRYGEKRKREKKKTI